jgi:hypothetical protein
VAESKRCWPGDTVDGLGLASGLAGQASQWMDTARPVPVAESICLAVDSVSKLVPLAGRALAEGQAPQWMEAGTLVAKPGRCRWGLAGANQRLGQIGQ